MAVHSCRRCGKLLSLEQSCDPCPVCGSRDRVVLAVDQAVAEAAQELAKRHFEVEEGLTHVFFITDTGAGQSSSNEPIKLLEVNENSVESGVMPLRFGPAPASGIPYSSIIIEVTPNEFKKIQSHELKLPDGWEIGAELAKPLDHAGGA